MVLLPLKCVVGGWLVPFYGYCFTTQACALTPSSARRFHFTPFLTTLCTPLRPHHPLHTAPPPAPPASYKSDMESDPFGEKGSVWSFNYFFYNRKAKRILYFSCRGLSKTAVELSVTTDYKYNTGGCWGAAGALAVWCRLCAASGPGAGVAAGFRAGAGVRVQ